MINKKFEKAYIRGYENSDNLKGMADYIVDKYVTRSGAGDELTDKDLSDIKDNMAIDMSVGAEVRRNGYILTGMLIGIGLTITIMTIKNKLNF